jgi:hypothetical protein
VRLVMGRLRDAERAPGVIAVHIAAE